MKWILPWLGYALIMAAVGWGFSAARQGVRERYGSRDAQQAWDAWRSDVAERTVRDSAVERDVPGSAAPPALVLLTDHFWACLGVSLVITTALYWTLALLIRGVIAPSPGAAAAPRGRPSS